MKLNLGGNEEFDGGLGSPRLENFINVDIRSLPRVALVADIRNGLLPEWKGQAEEIRASHVIEHMIFPEALAAVEYWTDFLRIGGLMPIHTIWECRR